MVSIRLFACLVALVPFIYSASADLPKKGQIHQHEFGYFNHAEHMYRAFIDGPKRKQHLKKSEAAKRFKQIENIHYELVMNLGTAETFSGSAVITFDLKKDANFRSQPLFLDFISEKDARIKSLSINRMAKRMVDHSKDRIQIPTRDLEPNKRNMIEVDFVAPYGTKGFGLTRNEESGKETDGKDRVYLYTQFEAYEANRMFPCFDQPDLKATFTLVVNAPEHWKVITTTREAVPPTASKGRKLWIFPTTQKIPTYAFSLHAGDYWVWEDARNGTHDLDLRLFARRGFADAAGPYVDTFFNAARSTVDYFDETLGPYQFGKIDSVIVPNFPFGAMENVGAVTYGERLFKIDDPEIEKIAKPRRIPTLVNVIAHEHAHMWAGNLVTLSWWEDFWLNESFADFLSHSALKAIEEDFGIERTWSLFEVGRKAGAYVLELTGKWRGKKHAIHPVWGEAVDTSAFFELVDPITYSKGGAILRQLQHVVGADNFANAMVNHHGVFKWGSVTRKNFIETWGGSLRRPADAFKDWNESWFGTVGINTVQAEFSCVLGKIETFKLHQGVATGPKIMRSHRTQVGLYYYDRASHSLKEGAKIPVTYAAAENDYSEAADGFVGKKCPDFVFPNVDWWDYVLVKLDPLSTRYLGEKKLNALPGDMNPAESAWIKTQHDRASGI